MIDREDHSAIGQLVRAFAKFAPSLVIPGIANLLLYPLISRVLTRDELGVFALATGIVALSPILCSNWLESAILRYGYRNGETLSPRDWRRATVVALVIAGASTALLVALSAGPAAAIILACAAMAVVSVGFTIMVAPLRAMGSFARYSAVVGLRSVLGLPGALIGAAVLGVPGAILGLYLPQVMLLPLARAPRGRTPTLSMSRALRYGVPISTMNVAASLLSVADRYVLSLSQPIGLVGIYVGTYVTMEQALRFIPSAASSAIAPTVYQAIGSGDRRKVSRILAVTTLLVVGADAVILAAMLLLSGIWLALLGSPFVAADVILLPVGLGLLAHAANQVLAIRYSALEQVGGLAANVWVAVTVNIVLNVALDPTYGIIAAAWATTAGYLVLLLLNLVQAFLRPGLTPRAAIAPGHG